eukprot:TRINITY_DN67_c0_g1_i1.p1 TRINITY_DN67_c0_g1~~TRINITY_DN67_c0_g1_i1.p1  ORF type:complete len:285 (+),score=74.37 TRINITY_DN67_c0_g1_i1:86-856(+)
MAKVAADIIEKRLQMKPDLVLGLATGSTPLPLYAELIERHKKKGLDFSHVKTFNLDEYLSLSPIDSQSYHYFMHENLFKHLNVSPHNIFIPKGNFEGINLKAVDIQEQSGIKQYCQWYENQIKMAGGIDLQVLGIGSNGHLAFNEPGSSFGSRTRPIKLTAQTIKDNSRFFSNEDQVPTHAITLGLGTILESKEVILLANSKNKANAIAAAAGGPITALCPASLIQLHPLAHVVIDTDAASQLHSTLRDLATNHST